MTLKEWQKNQWLKKEPTSAKEIADLFGLVERNLNDAAVDIISCDARLQFALNVVLSCATIALRASGYRIPATEGHHEKTINSLKYTIGCDSTLIVKFNSFRKKRINITYDSAGSTSQSEVDDLLELGGDLYDQVKRWLKEYHAELLK